MIKMFISVTSPALDLLPLSQTVTHSRTPSPSSVTCDILYGRPLIRVEINTGAEAADEENMTI